MRAAKVQASLTSAQSRQNLRCLLIQAVSQEKPSDRKPDPWPLWMAGHAQLKFVMTECSKTQIRLTGLKLCYTLQWIKFIFISNTIARRLVNGSFYKCLIKFFFRIATDMWYNMITYFQVPHHPLKRVSPRTKCQPLAFIYLLISFSLGWYWAWYEPCHEKTCLRGLRPG